jgi:putative ABC transport system permease protein
MGWRRYLWRRWWDEERARELQAHLDIEIDEHIARGVPPDEARHAARRKLGNLVRIREDIYDMNTMALVDAFWKDIRYGARLLRRDPAFTAVALLSLILGIGANTAIFQLLDAVRLRTLPVSHPEELVEVRIAPPRMRAGNFSGRYSELTNTQWEQIRAHQEPFSSVLAFGTSSFDLAEGGEVRRAQGLFVSGSFFDVLGVKAARGRVFSPSDDQRGCAARSAIISYTFWQREYGGDSGILGRTLRLEGRPFEIIGVTPESFYGVEVGRQYDVAVPICTAPVIGGDPQVLDESHVWWLSTLARLRPGWSISRADAYLKTISPGVFQQTLTGWFDPDQVKLYLAFKLEAVSRQTGVSSLRADYETPLWLLLGLSALVLLTACANLANLLLARASARMREISVRLATGASRSRIVRQLLAESLLLAFLGAVGGAILAQGASRFLVTFLSPAGSWLPSSVPGTIPSS